MAATKRKEVEASPDGDEKAKKVRTDEDEPVALALQSMAAKFQGHDDVHIGELFGSLRNSIENFALRHFNGSPYHVPSKNHHKAFFQSLSGSDCLVYLKSKDEGPKHSFIQAAIWSKLIEMLLGEPTEAFFHCDEATFKTWLSDDSGSFYALRSIAAQLLSKSAESQKRVTAWGPEGKRREDFITETADLLLAHATRKDPRPLKENLDTIADNASDLAEAMARCRAGWVCAMEHPDEAGTDTSALKTNYMEKYEVWDDDKAYAAMIDLRVAPMLLKYGNNKGQNMDSCRVVEKARVGMKPRPDNV